MSRNTKIFLVVFSIFLGVITVAAIFYKNSNKTINESQIIIESGQKIPNLSKENINNQNMVTKGVSLNDTYAVNGLKYEYEKTEINDIEVNLLKVSGLNNDNVEETINTELKERIKKILDSNNFKNNSDESAYVTTSVESNFSDVLSIKIFVKFSESYNKCYGLNYRLDTGERLKISDLFVYNAPKKNIISEAAYKSFALNYYTEEGMSNDFYTNIEGDVLEFLIDYNNGKITEFAFTPFTIELYREGKTVVIDMIDYYQYISIYCAFVSSSGLYEFTTGLAQKIPVFMTRPDCMYDLYEKVNDTCVLDVIIYTDEEFTDAEKKTIANYRKDLVSRLSGVKTEKGVYYSNYIKVSKSVENGEKILIFEENECFASCEENLFEDNIYNPIMSAERNKNNIDFDRSKIYFLDENMLISSMGIKKYSVKTTEEIKEVEENPEDEEEEDNNGDEEENQVDNSVIPSPTIIPSPEDSEEGESNSANDVPAVNITTEVIF